METSKAVYVFKLRAEPRVHLDVRSLRPDSLAGKELAEIRRIAVYEGNTRVLVEELFDVDGPSKAPQDPQAIELVVTGKGTKKLRFLGYRMSGGTVTVEGDIGPLAGFRMRGGTIRIRGNAGSWLGAKMVNGSIEVEGNAGDFVGAKLQGERPGRGMRGGMIVIRGSAGSSVGAGMGGGAIIVEGSAGNLVGSYMTGGSVLIMGGAGDFAGARMTGGRVVIAGKVAGVLPSFYVDSVVKAAKVKGRKIEKPFVLFMGDVLVNGRGSLFVAYPENEELLKPYVSLIEGG